MQFFFKILNSVILIVACQLSNAQSISNHANDDQIQKQVLHYINQYRLSKGLNTLQMNSFMVEEARKHSMEMAKHRMSFGHQGFLKRVSRLRSKIKNTAGAAENIAYNYKDAKTVVEQWILSSGHKRNIVGHYNLTGVGIARDPQGKIYFTQIFLQAANPNNSV